MSWRKIGKNWVGIIFLLLLIEDCSAEGDSVSPEDIINSWKERQTQTRLLNISCSGEKLVVLGSEPDLNGKLENQKVVPAENLKFPVSHHLILEGDNQKFFEWHTRIWSEEQEKYILQHGKQYQHGGNRIHYTPHGNLPHPTLVINQPKVVQDYSRSIILKPIALIYRPLLDVPWMMSKGSIQISDSRSTINGQECVEVTGTLPKGDSSTLYKIYLDPEKEFLPVRHSTLYKGRLHYLVEFQYHQDGNREWTPASWRIEYFDPKTGDLSSSFSIIVDELSINKVFPQDLFRVNPGPGTWVRNRITNENYIVKEDLSHRDVQHGEFRGDNYNELLKTESGELLQPKLEPVSIMALVLIAFSGMLLAAIVYWIYRRNQPFR